MAETPTKKEEPTAAPDDTAAEAAPEAAPQQTPAADAPEADAPEADAAEADAPEADAAEEDAQPAAAADASAEAAPADDAATGDAATGDAATEEAPKGKASKKAKQSRKHRAEIEDLLKAGSHFGHLTSRWNPKMKPYIFMERNGIHIIDLMQTQVMLDEAAEAAGRFAKQGKKILFVGTKKQARETIRKQAEACGQPYVVERWLGGTLTNFQTIRQSIRRMEQLKRMEEDGTLAQLKKKERLMKSREREKLEKTLGGIADMGRLPGALFVVDINREHIAVNEAQKLGIPIISLLDTNCDPDHVDYGVPANDDALKSIQLLTSVISEAINEGGKAREIQQAARGAEQEKRAQDQQETAGA